MKARIKGGLRADWKDLVFLNFRVDPALLQAATPFPLDLYEGKAYVSLVAFRMERFRIPGLPAWLHPLVRPFGEHAFLNVRTYVKVGDERGIYFLSELVASRLSRYLGPLLFGLPYRMGKIEYRNPDGRGELSGIAEGRGKRIGYAGRLKGPAFRAEAGTPEHFLAERYTAFTRAYGLKRRFRIWHESWMLRGVELGALDTEFLTRYGAWGATAEFTNAFYSEGVIDVEMSRPEIFRVCDDDTRIG